MALSAHLAALEASGLIRLAAVDSDLEYLFRHALVQEAAYASLLKADRKQLHLAVGETVEYLYPDRLSELAPVLARHFSAAGDEARALKYFALAGDAALKSYANAEAESHYRAALALVAAAPERARLLSGLGEALLRQSRFEEAGRIWREAITAYQSVGDHAGVARMYTRAARTAGTAHGGDAPRALALCREGLTALSLVEGEGQPESSALAALLHETGRACFFNGLLDEARSFCQQALTLAERLGDLETQAETLATLWGLLPVSSPEAAIEGLQRAAALAETTGRLDSAARIHHNLGFRLGIEQGELQRGRAHVQHALELHRKIGNEASQFYSLDVSIILSFLLGDFADVEKTLKGLYALLPSVGNRELGVASLRGWEAWLLRCRGEWAAARDAFQMACAGFRQHQAFDTLANVDCTLADLLLELDDVSMAEAVLQEALELAGRGFMEPVEPRCLLVALYARQGRMEEARRVLTETREQAGPQPGAFVALSLALAEARRSVAERRWSSAFDAFEAACARSARHNIRWQRAQILREWAEAHVARGEPGDGERARALLREAQTEFENMNVPKYAALVSQRLQEL
jgi:tetratricopeptide (TPR) repeat protein